MRLPGGPPQSQDTAQVVRMRSEPSGATRTRRTGVPAASASQRSVLPSGKAAPTSDPDASQVHSSAGVQAPGPPRSTATGPAASAEGLGQWYRHPGSARSRTTYVARSDPSQARAQPGPLSLTSRS